MVVEEDEAEEGLVEGKEGLARVKTLSACSNGDNKHTPHNVSIHKNGLSWLYVCDCTNTCIS